MNPILIFRRGSIGDAVVSVPALNEIARRYPNNPRWILTNRPVMETAAAIEEVLQNSTLVDGFISMPPGSRMTWPDLKRALREIRTLGPETLIYLSEPSGIFGGLRERLFFRACGIRHTIGLPYPKDAASYRKIEDGLWESESRRLLRVIGFEPGELDWSFHFLDEERAATRTKLNAWPGKARYIFFSVGAKLPDKDWGDANWKSVLAAVSNAHPTLGIVAVGAPDEASRTDGVLAAWRGPTLNLCGMSPPRDSALIAEGSVFYLGHDSGNMHLAGLAGTPCVAVFAARHKPGAWYPRGTNNRIYYPWDAVADVPDRAGFRTGGATIHTIRPEEVIQGCLDLLATSASS